jgi:hypothetical protein
VLRKKHFKRLRRRSVDSRRRRKRRNSSNFLTKLSRI